MKLTKEERQMDAVAEDGDEIEVEIMKQHSDESFTLYVHVNSITVLRIGKLQRDQIRPSNNFTMNRCSNLF